MDTDGLKRSQSLGTRRAIIASTQEIAPRAPFERQLSDDVVARPPARPVRAQSARSDTLATRRNAHTEFPMRMPMPAHMSRETDSQDSARTVASPSSVWTPGARSTRPLLSPMGSHMAAPMRRRSSITHQPQIFGHKTVYRPGYLLAASNVGTALFGIGEVVLQRSIWPAKSYSGLDGDNTIIPSGTPGTGNFTGSHNGDIVIGSMMMGVGITTALTSSFLFLQDAQALARRQQPNGPNLRRPRAYYATHQVGLALLIGHRFFAELARPALPPSQYWVTTIPAAIGTAIFAVTQAQSFSSSELYNGPMPLKYRGAISQVARACVSSWIVLGVLAGTPNMSSYLREGVKLVATSSTVVAYSLSLTTARLLARDMPTQPVIGPVRYRGDLTAMQAFSLYAVARFISSAAAAIVEIARWPAVRDAVKPPISPPPTKPPNEFFRGLPPPLPNAPANYVLVSEAAFLMSIAIGMASYAFWQFRQDALPRGRCYANAMFASAVACMLLGQTYRVLIEHAKDHADFEKLWIALPFGVLANAIAFVVIPELFSQSEITSGNREIPYRYQVMEGCRAAGAASWAAWVGVSSVQFVPPLVRQCLVTAASLLSILGMSLSDSTTRARQIGAELTEFESYELR